MGGGPGTYSKGPTSSGMNVTTWPQGTFPTRTQEEAIEDYLIYLGVPLTRKNLHEQASAQEKAAHQLLHHLRERGPGEKA